jgi:hypothetical protein
MLIVSIAAIPGVFSALAFQSFVLRRLSCSCPSARSPNPAGPKRTRTLAAHPTLKHTHARSDVMSEQHVSGNIAEADKHRRLSRRVANAANGKKTRGGRTTTQKLKKPLCVSNNTHSWALRATGTMHLSNTCTRNSLCFSCWLRVWPVLCARVQHPILLCTPLCFLRVCSQTVDFNKLEMSSLLKYKRHFKLPLRPDAPKVELISHIRKHFVHHPRLRDVDVISAFLYANQQQKLQNKQALQQAAQQVQEAKALQAAAASAAAAAGR